MLHGQKILMAFGTFTLSFAWTTVAQTVPQKPEPWLLQSMHVAGDTVEGFRKTCIIVYPDGEYHRERQRQASRNGRASFDWEPPEVAEGKLTENEFSTLNEILETPEFSSIRGVVGHSRNLLSQLLFNRQGAIIPHETFEIVTVAVARSNGQLFEITDMDAARQRQSVRAFLDWINGIERSQGRRIASSRATDCLSDVAAGDARTGKAPIGESVTIPRAIYAPPPQLPPGSSKPRPVPVQILINPDGSVAEASLQSHAAPDAAQSALGMVRKWKFQPARLLGVPVAFTLRFDITFRDQ
jgi:TonB family protein